MGTDRLRTPCPPDVLLSAYAVEPDPGRGPGTTDARHVAGLTVLDGYLCAAVGGAGGVPGELLVVDHAGVQGTAAQGGAVQGGAVPGPGVRGAGVPAAPRGSAVPPSPATRLSPALVRVRPWADRAAPPTEPAGCSRSAA